MKVAIADNQALKFDRPLKEHWEKKHEVKYEIGASEHLFQWCDLYYINFWDNNIHYLYNWHKKHPKVKKPIIVCRALDWEVWRGMVRSQEMVDWVDHAICIAPHIMDRLDSEVNFGEKLRLIRPGVDLEKFTIKKVFNRHNIIMPVIEIDWILKNTLDGIRIFGLLKQQSDLPWKLTIKGKWTGQSGGEYFQIVVHDLIEKLGVKDDVAFVTEHVPDFNTFLDDFDYCLVPSLKEAFSYVTAECMAKGMKPVLNWWYGAEEIWSKSWMYTDHQKAVELFLEEPKPGVYRRFMRERYSLERMLNEYDEECGL